MPTLIFHHFLSQCLPPSLASLPLSLSGPPSLRDPSSLSQDPPPSPSSRSAPSTDGVGCSRIDLGGMWQPRNRSTTVLASGGAAPVDLTWRWRLQIPASSMMASVAGGAVSADPTGRVFPLAKAAVDRGSLDDGDREMGLLRRWRMDLGSLDYGGHSRLLLPRQQCCGSGLPR